MGTSKSPFGAGLRLQGHFHGELTGMLNTKSLRDSSTPSFVLGLALTLLGTTQVRAEKLVAPDRGTEQLVTAAVSFEEPAELDASGWTETTPGVWQKTFDNGVEAELAIGAPAHDRALSWLDAEIAALEAVEEPDDEQLLRLFELVVRRAKLIEAVRPTKALTGSSSVCGGTASFEHNYGWANLAYAFAEADSKWTRWMTNNGTVTTYAQAAVCVDGDCSPPSIDIDHAQNPSILESHAYASPVPSYECDAHANGYVQVPQATPFCQPLASFSTSWSCGDPIP